MKTFQGSVRAPRILALVALAQALTADDVRAQAPGEEEQRPRVGCLRGQPLPACKSFWLIEMQGHTPLAQTSRWVQYSAGGPPAELESFESELEWNLGHMVNLTPTLALGGMLTAGTGAGDPFVGLKARARRWIGPSWSVEVSAGYIRSDARYPVASGVSTDLRLNIRDHGAFFLRWDGVSISEESHPGGHFDPGGFEQAVSAGVGLGSMPALIGTGALGLGYVILMGIFLAHVS